MNIEDIEDELLSDYIEPAQWIVDAELDAYWLTNCAGSDIIRKHLKEIHDELVASGDIVE